MEENFRKFSLSYGGVAIIGIGLLSPLLSYEKRSSTFKRPQPFNYHVWQGRLANDGNVCINMINYVVQMLYILSNILFLLLFG